MIHVGHPFVSFQRRSNFTMPCRLAKPCDGLTAAAVAAAEAVAAAAVLPEGIDSSQRDLVEVFPNTLPSELRVLRGLDLELSRWS